MNRTSNSKHWLAWTLLVIALVIVFGLKAIDRGWFAPRPPLDLGDQPALLFFNNENGCECMSAYYQQADAEIESWGEDQRLGLPLHRIHLEQRKDIGEFYAILRAPARYRVVRAWTDSSDAASSFRRCHRISSPSPGQAIDGLRTALEGKF
jgi:hypothetical protein